MIPINMVSKLVRARSQVTLATKTFVTSGTLWKEMQGGQKGGGCCPKEGVVNRQSTGGLRDEGDKHSQQKSSGCSEKEQEYLLNKRQGEGGPCGATRHSAPDTYSQGQPKSSGFSAKKQEHLSNKRHGGSPCGTTKPSAPDKCSVKEQEYISNKRHGESSCGATKHSVPDKCSQERHHIKTNAKGEDKGKCGSQNEKQSTGTGCACPSYAKPTRSEEKQRSRTPCGERQRETNTISKGEEVCEPPQSITDPCEIRQNKCPKEEDKCGPRIANLQNERKCETPQSRPDPCGSRKSNYPREENGFVQQKRNECETDAPRKDMCPSDMKKCPGGDNRKRYNYCGPIDSNRDDCQEEDKTDCKRDRDFENPCKAEETTCKEEEERANICKEKDDPCETSRTHNKCPDRDNECEEKPNPSCRNPTPTTSCSDELEQNVKECNPNQCVSPGRYDCAEDCADESPAKCPGKRTFEVPELAAACKIDAARECLNKLKELQIQWEEVIAAQECGKTANAGDCARPQQTGQSRCQEHSRKAHRGSNMTVVVLSAVLVAIVYYAYNGDFEPEHLFREDVEREKDDDDDEDDD